MESSLTAAAATKTAEELAADLCSCLQELDGAGPALQLAESLKKKIVENNLSSDKNIDKNYVDALERQVTLLSASLSLRGVPKKLVDRSSEETDALLAMRNELDVSVKLMR